MTYQARWGDKGFIVSSEKIVPITGFSTTVALKRDSENDTSGKSATNTRGKEAQEVAMSTVYVKSAGVNPRAQYEEWGSLVGKKYPLYIGGKKFGPGTLMLTEVGLAGIAFAPNGEFLKAEVNLKFLEVAASTKKATSSSSAKGKSNADNSDATKTKSTTRTGRLTMTASEMAAYEAECEQAMTPKTLTEAEYEKVKLDVAKWAAG